MLNSYPTRSPQQNKNLNETRISSNILPPEITSTPLNSPNRLKTSNTYLTPPKKLLSPRRYALSSNGTVSPLKTLKNPPGPLLTSANFNVSMSTYLDSKSPGFAGRVVQYSEEKARNQQQHTHQEQYGSPGLFPIVHLFKKDLPVISPKPRKATIRIGTPEFKNQYGQEHNRLLLEGIVRNKLISKEPSNGNDVSTRSVLDALKEISRKRIHASEEYDLIDESKKKLKRDDDDILKSNSDGGDYSKRNRVDSPTSETSSPPTRQATKKLCTIDAILASKTSSMYANYDVGIKRKTIEHQTKISPINKKKFSNAETQTTNSTTQSEKTENKESLTKPKDVSSQSDFEKNDRVVEETVKTPPPKQVLKVFDDKPLEIIRKNRLGALLSALTGKEIPQIPMEDRRKELDQDWSSEKKPTSILSTPSKRKTPEKRVTFSLTREQNEKNETTQDVQKTEEKEKEKIEKTQPKSDEIKSNVEPSKSSSNIVVGGFKFDLTKPETNSNEPVKDDKKDETNAPQLVPPMKLSEKKQEEPKVTSTPSILSFTSPTGSMKPKSSVLPKSPSNNSLGLPISLPKPSNSTQNTTNPTQTKTFSIQPTFPTSQTQTFSSQPTITTASIQSLGTFVSPTKNSISSPKTTFSSPQTETNTKPFTFSSNNSDKVTTTPVFSFGKSENVVSSTSTTNLNFGTVVTSINSMNTTTTPSTSVTSFGSSSGVAVPPKPSVNFSFNSVQPVQSVVSSSTQSIGNPSSKNIFSVTSSNSSFSPTSTVQTVSSSSPGGFSFKTPSLPAFSTGNVTPFSNTFGVAKPSFGVTTAAVTETKNTGPSNSFNLTPTTTTSSFGVGVTSGTTSIFGSPSTTNANASKNVTTTSGGFKMGGNEVKSFTFGSDNNNVSNTSSLPSNSLMFSFKNTQSGMGFGTTSSASTASNFATTAPQFSSTSGSGTSGNMFSFEQKTQTPNLFGGTTTNSLFNTTTSGNFGNFTTTNTTTSSFVGSASNFGAPNTTNSSMFGGNFGKNTTSGFGGTTSFGTTTSNNSGFGTNTPTFGVSTTSSPSMFGTSNTLSFGTTNATTTASSFGATNAPPPAFGASFNAPTFGNATTPFGASVTTTTTGTFNGSTTNSTLPFGGTSSTFGGFTGNGNNSPFPVGNSNATPSFGTNNNNTFGGNSNFGGSSGFGGTSNTVAAPFGATSNNSFGNNTVNAGSTFNFSGASKKSDSIFPTPSGGGNNMFGGSGGNNTTGFGANSSTNPTTNAGLFTFGSPNTQTSPSSGVFTFGATDRPKSFNFSAPNAQNTSFSGGAGFSNSTTALPFQQQQPANNNPMPNMFSIGSGASSTSNTQNRGRPLVRAKRRI